jgi:hypothetical protein
VSTATLLQRVRRRVVMAEIGQPDRVVRRERENEPLPTPAIPATQPEIVPAK